MRAGRDLAAALDRHALPGNRLVLHHEGDEPALGAVGLHAAEDVDALELLVERARPPEAGRDRVGVRADVVAVQRVADLEAQRVAGAEPARDGAALEHGVPQPDRVLAHAEQLATVLAGVAGAVHHHLDSVDRALGEGERRRGRQPEPLDRPRPLDGEQRTVVGDVADVRAGKLALLQPRVGRRAVRGVHDEEVGAVADPVDDQVVDDPAALVREQRVLRLTGLELVDVVGERALQEGRGRAAPPPRARPCATRRRPPHRSARPGAPGSRPRTARASPSPRTAPCAPRARRADRGAACAGASRPSAPDPRAWLLRPGSVKVRKTESPRLIP